MLYDAEEDASSHSSFVIQARTGETQSNIISNTKTKSSFGTGFGDDRFHRFVHSKDSSSFGASFASAQDLNMSMFSADEILDEEKLQKRMKNYRLLIYGTSRREVPKWQRLNPFLDQPWKEYGSKFLRGWKFSTFIMLCVIVNAIILAMYDPVAKRFQRPSDINHVVGISEIIFITIFSAEAISKIICYGPQKYFRSGWNIFDFSLVVLGIVNLGLDEDTTSVNFSALRCLRILRLFKSLTYIKNLGLIVRALMDSSKQLGQAAILFLVFILVFGLSGVVLFQGKFHQRCARFDPTTEVLIEYIPNDLCSLQPNQFGERCPEGYECAQLEDTESILNAVSFDSLPLSLFTVFQILTLEGWANVMQSTMKTSPAYYVLYYVLIIVLGAFFLLNLLVVVLSSNYSRLREEKQIGKVDNNKIFLDVANLARQRNARRNDLLNLDIREQIKKTEFRLMYSYEMHSKDEGYKILTEDEYNALCYKYRHRIIDYNDWRIEVIPILQKQERSRRLQILGSKQFSRSIKSNASSRRSGLEKESIGLNFIPEAPTPDPYDDSQSFDAVSLPESETDEDQKAIREELVNDTKKLLERAESAFRHDDSMGPLLRKLKSALEEPPPPVPTSITVYDDEVINRPRINTQSAKNLIAQSIRNVKSAMKAEPLTEHTARGLLTDKQSIILAYTIVQNIWFQRIISVLIGANILLLSFQRFDASEDLRNTILIGNSIFTGIFLVELGLKLYAFGATYYFSKFFNVLDAFVIIPSLFELILGSTTAISAFRVLRLFQILTLPNIKQYAEKLSHLIHVIGLTLRHICPFALVLLIFMFLCSVSGLHLFGARLSIDPLDEEYDCYKPEQNFSQEWLESLAVREKEGNFTDLLDIQHGYYCPQRANYDTFLWSFVTTFQIITLSDWNNIFDSLVYEAQHGSGSVTLAYFYFIVVIILGPFLILQLFLAVLIDTFNEAHSDRLLLQKQAIANENEISKDQQETISPEETDKPKKLKKAVSFSDRTKTLRLSSQTSALSTGSNLEQLAQKLRYRHQRAKSRFDPATHNSFRHKSMFCLPPENKFRRRCAEFINNKHVETIILIAVVFSCILLVFDDSSSQRDFVFICNAVLAAIFSLEVVMKMVSFGVIMNEGAYFHDAWNVLDFVVTAVIIFDLLYSGSERFVAIKILRCLRILRPLRVIRRFESLRIVVGTLLKALVPCLQVAFICLIFYWATAVLSVTFIGGKTYSCYFCVDEECIFMKKDIQTPVCHDFPFNDKLSYIERCEGYARCEDLGGKWKNPTYGSLVTRSANSHAYGFDTLFESMLTLYEVSTLEQWTEVVHATSDIVDVGVETRRFSSIQITFAWLIFVAVTNFFLLQVFVAVVVEKFLLTSDQETGSAFMSPKQVRWVEAKQQVARSRPPTDFSVRRGMKMLSFVTHRHFKNFITVVIVWNTLVLCTKHFQQSEFWTNLQDVTDIFCAAIYIMEAGLKILAFGASKYFKSGWNRFDFFVVLAVLADFLLRLLPMTRDSENLQILQNFEILRVFRVFRLLRRLSGLSQIMNTVVASLPSIMNITIVLFLALFMFAVLAVELFGGAFDPKESEGYGALNEYTNFNSFGNSLLTLTVMATGEQWNVIMHDYYDISSNSIWFCVLFMLVVEFTILNLFVAVILSEFLLSFNNLKRDQEVDSCITEFANVWCKLNLKWEKALTRKIGSEMSTGMRRNSDFTQSTAPSINLTSQQQKAVKRLVKRIVSPKYLPFAMFHSLVEQVPPPLGMRGLLDSANFVLSPGDKMKIISLVKIPVTKTGLIHYQDTLSALVDYAMSSSHIPQQVRELLEYRLPSKARAEKKNNRLKHNHFSLSELYATTKLQVVIRSFVAISRAKRLRNQGYSRGQIEEMMVDSEKKALAAKVFSTWLS